MEQISLDAETQKKKREELYQNGSFEIEQENLNKNGNKVWVIEWMYLRSYGFSIFKDFFVFEFCHALVKIDFIQRNKNL